MRLRRNADTFGGTGVKHWMAFASAFTGMAAVVSRVEQLAGKIEVTSRKGLGTVWRFSFPPSALEGRGHAPSRMRQKGSGGIGQQTGDQEYYEG